MTSSSLARRLEEYDAELSSRRLPPPVRPPLSVARARSVNRSAAQKTGRSRRRVTGIRTADSGLRLFRVC